MPRSDWSEAANRRLRAFLWKGWPVTQVAVALGRTTHDVAAQMQRLKVGVRPLR